VSSGFSGLLPLRNPSRAGAARIAWQLVDAQPARLRVYDVRGRLVRDFGVVPGEVGTWSVNWDGRGAGGATVAAGVYLVQLELGSRRLTEKLVVIR
jgi:hypothetical protein